jgi:zinc-ribbon domain
MTILGTFCSHCGSELATEDADVCTKCGKFINKMNPSSIPSSSGTIKKPTRAWYLFPIIMGFIGGIIAYFVLRNEDRVLAKNCLIFGIVWSVFWFISTISVAFLGGGRHG